LGEQVEQLIIASRFRPAYRAARRAAFERWLLPVSTRTVKFAGFARTAASFPSVCVSRARVGLFEMPRPGFNIGMRRASRCRPFGRWQCLLAA
jgi:hypothetical protein